MIMSAGIGTYETTFTVADIKKVVDRFAADYWMIGQMSTLINQAFQTVTQEAGKSRLSFLIIDEGDSLAGSRDAAQSHHEDKVAVNTGFNSA